MFRLHPRPLILFALVASVLGLAGSASAQLDETEKAYWQDRYRGVLDDYDRAKAAYDAAELRYKEAQRANRRGSGSKRSRGEEREAIKAAVPESAAQLGQAKDALDEFPETARHAGVPPGWLREVDDRRADAKLDAERDAAIEANANPAGNTLLTDDVHPADSPSDDVHPADSSTDDVHRAESAAPADRP